MQFPLYCVIVISLIIKSTQINGKRIKRTNMNNFNILLNIYKMNPLKKSKIYKTFFDNVLLPHRPEADVRSVAMNFDSNESRKERQASTNLHLEQIEKFIHVTNRQKKVDSIKQPYYDIQNIASEKFIANVLMKHPSENSDSDKKVSDNNFNAILGHLESSEINDQLPVTKMVRVNNTITNSNRVSSITDYNEIGLNDDYTDFAKKVNSSENFSFKIGNEINVIDRVNDIRNAIDSGNEGVVVLR